LHAYAEFQTYIFMNVELGCTVIFSFLHDFLVCQLHYSKLK